MIVYFSGTGNSRYAAELLGDRLGDEVIDSAGFIKNGIAADLISGRPWVFVAPVYAWSFPKVFGDFIRSGYFSGEDRAYFVLTCGGSMGAAWDHTEALCREKGLCHMGTFASVMPENYVAMLPVPSGEKALKIIRKAEIGLELIAEKISRGEKADRPKNGFLGKFKSGPVNEAFAKYYISDKKFRTEENCISCGKCAEICPLGNISLEDGRPRWKGNCTHCMACICTCPTAAIEYGRTSRGKPRYLCPKYGKQ